MKCGEILDIRMLDHIIVAGETGEMLSMKKEGMMPNLHRRERERYQRHREGAVTSGSNCQTVCIVGFGKGDYNGNMNSRHIQVLLLEYL